MSNFEFNFTPLTDEQIEELSEPWAEGEYDFEVVNAVEHISPKQNKSIKLILKVLDKAYNQKKIYDYLVDDPKMIFKIKHFCEACGLADKYFDGSLTKADMVNKTGKLHLIIRPAKDGYEASNSVKDYIVQKDTAAEKQQEDLQIDDDIAF